MDDLNFLVNRSRLLHGVTTRSVGYILAAVAVESLVTVGRVDADFFTTRSFSNVDLAASYGETVCFGPLVYQFQIMRAGTVNMPETDPENRSQAMESSPH
jgi:hypothetical protein